MKNKVLLLLPTHSSFMKVDEDILNSAYEVKTIYLQQDVSRKRYFLMIVRALLTLIFDHSYQKVLIWFADYHSAPFVLLSKWKKIPSFIFIGGYDAVKYPELGMGVYCSRVRGWCAKIALKNCTHIISNHIALLSSNNTYYKPEGHKDGIYNLIPGLKTPASVIFNAVSISPPAIISEQRLRQVVTAGSTPRFQDFYNKGFDLLTDIAQRRPDMSFVFVGIDKKWLPELNKIYHFENLPNITIYTYLPQKEFFSLLELSSVYAQPSISEGMPNSLMEAMLAGCIPVGSNVAGIPTIIDKYGYIIDHRDSQELEKALDLALETDADRKEISESIQNRFNSQPRKEKLLKLLNKY